jgi:hypothetical protein
LRTGREFSCCRVILKIISIIINPNVGYKSSLLPYLLQNHEAREG